MMNITKHKALECDNWNWNVNECDNWNQNINSCASLVLESWTDDAMETKIYKTLMHWFKMVQYATKELKAYLNNNVKALNDMKSGIPWGQFWFSIMIAKSCKPTTLTSTLNQIRLT